MISNRQYTNGSPSSLFKFLLRFFSFVLLINVVSSATTLCNTITTTGSIEKIAFGNYLSFTGGMFLAFFRSPSKDEKGFFALLKNLVNRTAVAQLMALMALMTYMTYRFFVVNTDGVPKLIRICSIIMYSLCGVISLTVFITNSWGRLLVRAILFTPLYLVQMVFQAYLVQNFPSSGLVVYQWISILSILVFFPLLVIAFIVVVYRGSSPGLNWDDNGRNEYYFVFLYPLAYPFVFQIYLHVGYIWALCSRKEGNY